MQENALAIARMELTRTDLPTPCSLRRYFSSHYLFDVDNLFVWESKAVVQQGGPYGLESKFQLHYHPPKLHAKLLDLLGAKPRERGANSILLEMIIRNPSEDPELLSKISLGTPMGGNVYFVGDAIGGQIGHYNGEDIMLQFRLNPMPNPACL